MESVRNPLTVALAGDVMLGRLMNDALERHGPQRPWKDVLPLLAGADAFFFNLENAICGDLPEWEPDRKTFHFRMDPAHLDVLADCSVDAVQLANNHVMDYDVAGLEETLNHLHELEIPYAGAGRNLDEAREPALVDAPDGRVIGLVAAADHMVEWGALPDEPGIFLIDPAAEESVRAVANSIAAARAAGADVVVLGLHWGPNMSRVPTHAFRHFARRAVDAGADVVWGTSAHLFQGIEFYKDRAILYDTGDFLDDYAIDPHERNDRNFLFRVLVEEDGTVPGVELEPVTIEDRCTRCSTEEGAEWSVARMRELCAEFGTRVTSTPDNGWVAQPAATRAAGAERAAGRIPNA